MSASHWSLLPEGGASPTHCVILFDLLNILVAEGRFPIDIRSVQSDHEFLGPDSLRALYRRLNTLNRCAIMRIDQVVLRRRVSSTRIG